MQSAKRVLTPRRFEAALSLESDKLFSVVVFVGESTFKTAMPENVTYGRGYIRYIKSKTQPQLSETEVQQIIQRIADGRLKPSIKTHRQHARHVREIVAAKNEPAQSSASKSCPKCGSEMKLRTAKKGPNAGSQFWGCSSFPKCHAIADVEQASTT